jgi:hypothetical protein
LHVHQQPENQQLANQIALSFSQNNAIVPARKRQLRFILFTSSERERILILTTHF